MKHNSCIVRSSASRLSPVGGEATSVVKLSHVAGAAAVTAVARAKGLSSTDRFILTLGAWALGSALAHELGGEQAAKEYSIGMLTGAVQLGA